MGTHLALRGRGIFPDPAHDGTAAVTDEDVPFEADGELVGYAPVTFQIAARQLSVLAPPPR